MNKQSVVSIIVIIVSLGVIGILIFKTKQSTDIRSKAFEQKQISIPTPQKILTAPYIRLISKQNTTQVGEMVDVDIVMKNQTTASEAVRITLQYDAAEFVLQEQSIQNLTIYPVINIESISPGQVTFSLFITPEAGYEPIILQNEQPIARLAFQVVGDKGKISQISILDDDTNPLTTAIFGSTSQEGEIGPNLLQSVEGLLIAI